MNSLNDDLDDSALLCMSVFQKRKATDNLNSKNSKQLKLNFTNSASKLNQQFSNEFLEFVGEEKKPPNSQDKYSKETDYISNYFTERKNLNNCPLCLKSFHSNAGYVSHMKQCAKKRKMTTQQLLGALELQKKQLGERKAMGLCSQKECFPKKVKKKSADKVFEDYDLALGLALSKSLEKNTAKSKFKIDLSHAEPQVLEEFGFTSSITAPGPSRKRNKIVKKSILRDINAEERQKIITEKAAVVLLAENERKGLVRNEERVFISNNMQLKKLQKQEPFLWNLGENENKSHWHVEKLQSLLQIGENHAKVPPPPVPDMQSIILKLNLPVKNIYQDWKKMINSEKYSDWTGRTKDGQIFHFHSLIAYARCQNILDKNLKCIFEEFNLSTTLIFLEYLYCGTLNGLTLTEMDGLVGLAKNLQFLELINVLDRVKIELTKNESEAPSNSNKDFIEEEKEDEVTVVEENFLVQDMVDLTQSSHEDDVVEKSDDFNEDKSFWNFLQHEKEREKLAEEIRQEEEKESLEITTELEKIETSMKQQEEMMKRILDEFEKEESSEVGKMYSESDSETKDLEEFQNKINKLEECIVLSSDTDTRGSKPEDDAMSEIKTLDEVDYEIPYYDPYDNFDRFSPVAHIEDIPSQSLITGDVSLSSETVEKETMARCANPEYFSTPVSNRQCQISSSVKKTLSKNRRSNLSASRIIRKSLGLRAKSSSSGRKEKSKARKTSKRKSSKVDTDLADTLTSSIMKDLCSSPLFNTSTPRKSENFIELTPHIHREVESAGDVTPSPNFSALGESLIKKQLSKYGLKRNLAKSKAKKILRHIYEELHPILNTKTGKLVKMIPAPSPRRKKKKPNAVEERKTAGKSQRNGEVKFSKGKASPSANSGSGSNESFSSLDKSTDCNSEGSEFEDFSEPLTQTASTDPLNLPSAFGEFLAKNHNFHQDILLYEPIWLEDLQKSLKETFKKNFKLSDLMDYLDQQCITFRSVAQKKNNEKRTKEKGKTEFLRTDR